MKVIAIYPGRFQPWHLGHKSVYDVLVRQFGVDNVYIATSDKVDPPRSPFNFAEKQQIIAATGIDTARVVQTRDPYKALEITSQYDPQDTKLLFAVSAKDMAEDPRFKSWTKRDGTPAYFQPAPNKVSEMEDFDQHGYIFVVPTLDFKVDGKPMRSATEFRKEFAAADAATKASMTRGILGTDDPQLVKLLASKITEGKKMKSNDVVNETTAGAIGSVVVPLGATQRRKIKEVDNKKKPTPGDVLDHARRAREHTGQKPIKEVTEPKVGDEYTTSKGGTVTRTARGLKHTQSPTAGKDVKPGSPSKVPLDRYKLHSQPRSMFSGDLSEAAETGIFPPNASPIQVGSTGNLVNAWQWTLSKLGLSTTIDGKFGNITKQQTIKFQQENNITPSDGSVKSNTYSAANTVLQDRNITNNPFLQAVKTVVQRITGSLPNMPVAKTVFDFFKSKGYNDIQAAAFVGNFAHESGFSGSALNPNDAGSPSFGLAQWKLDRLEALKKFAAKLGRPYTDLATQLEFVMAELGRSHARANAALQATPNDLSGAVRAIQSKYEVGANYEPRFKFAQVALQQFAPETFASMTNQPAVSEGAVQQLSVKQLAAISDEALDSAYHYGRSSPGNTFGWQANLKSAAFAKKIIDAGVTDIEKISDAIHKGWWSVAQKFVDDPDQFDDTETLRAKGKFDKKMADRIAQMVPFNQLTKDQQDIDRVVARAMLKAITGEQGVAEGDLKEFAPGNGGGESGRWYTDDQLTDLVGDGWWNDLDISGDISKQEMIQEAQAWLDDQGYSVQVLNCKVNDDNMEWYIEGSFQNSGFAKKGMAEATGDERFDSMMGQITGGAGARQGVDSLNKSLTARTGSDPETALAKWGQEFIKWLEDICRNFSRQGVDRVSKLKKLSEFEDGGETMAYWLIDVAKQTKTSGITLADIQEFSSEFNTYGMWPWQQFFIAWSQGEWQDYKDQWTGPDGYIANLGQGVAEGGPFSYGKPPRKGSVADLAAKRRKEQDRKTPPIELKDQMVGNAKVTKDVKEAWSQKYKNSINCSHPKGFSQKAHCAGKKKHSESTVMEMTCPDCGMCKSHGSLTEIKKGQKDSNGYTKCWPGKHAEGTKTGKNGGQVRNCVPNDGVTEDFKMKSDFRKESDAALADFLSRGGEIETVPPNRVRVKPGQSLASKHIGSKRETGRIVGKDRRVNGNKPVVNVSEVNDYFKRRKHEEDRIAGTKPPAKRTPQQTDYQKRRAQEKAVVEAKQKPSAQERFNARLKTKHGIDLDAMERQWAERTKKIEAEIAALREKEKQVSEGYYRG
jgi:hypothetical protein